VWISVWVLAGPVFLDFPLPPRWPHAGSQESDKLLLVFWSLEEQIVGRLMAVKLLFGDQHLAKTFAFK
jgi:hypothetical protein